MRTNTNLATLVLLLLAGACGGGGGSSGSSGNGGSLSGSFGSIQLLGHSPADDEVQVPVDGKVILEFDAAIALDSLGDEDTWLREAGSTQNVPGSFALETSTRVVFTPASPLDLETDYQFQLSALTCDLDGRILDTTLAFSFRTLDTTPPQLGSVDVVDNSIGVSRTRTFVFTFSEQVDQATLGASSLYLRDNYGTRYAASHTVDGPRVMLDPHADLPGDRQCFLIATPGIRDRAGNALPNSSTTRFRTENDTDAPSVVSSWPATNSTGVSPAVQPTITFSESMDPATVEAASLLFQDQYGSVVPFVIHASDDQRILRIQPSVTLQPLRQYTLAFLLGGAAATDVSGNPLEATQALVFTTGTDMTAPAVASSVPGAGETRVSGNAVLYVTFDEALDAAWVDQTTVQFLVGGADWTSVVELATPTKVRVTPVLTLPTDAVCELTLRGGHAGLRDLAGNVMASDQTLSFTTSQDSSLPHVMLLPSDGATSVSTAAHASVVFDAPMDPATLHAGTVQLLDDAGQPIAGTLQTSGGNRVVTITPDDPLWPFTYYRLRVVGGSGGARKPSGTWFSDDQTARFRTGSLADTTAPTVVAKLNGIDESRSQGLVLPASGFTVDAVISDNGSPSVDMGSVEVLFAGAGAAPGAATLLAAATIGYGTFRVVVPAEAALAAGDWTLTVRARDLSRNLGTSAVLSFAVAAPTGTLLPFERTQVVWVRTDLDRDGNGRPDFADDMQRLGFATEGDPIGSNQRMQDLVLAGILAQANNLYGRGDRGEPIDGGSVGLRFTMRQPIALSHTQIALGGLDPEGDRRRTYGAESTGILGRAYYDYRNGNIGERNTSSQPGLGVFPAEMWLYQTHIHEQVWPSFQTVFAQRFRPLCPDMGGTPAGAHPLDAIVLAPGFDHAAANSAQRARWSTVMEAADDWATVMGIILAHEVGHSVGLVAPGPAPSGLFGDSSLHDTYAGAAEVMAPSVGYEAMTTLTYAFRDIDLAYLRQRILLR